MNVSWREESWISQHTCAYTITREAGLTKVQLLWLLHCVYSISITASKTFERTYASQMNGSRSVFAGRMISYPNL